MFISSRDKGSKEATKFFDDFADSVFSQRWWEKSWTPEEVVHQSYKAHIYPGNLSSGDIPEEYPDYILNQMQYYDFHDYVNDICRLMEKYPDKIEDLLELCANTEMEGRRPLNRLAYYFFNDDNIRDTTIDDNRHLYLSVLQKYDFPISEYDRRIIAAYMPEFSKRNSSMDNFRGHPKLNFAS